MEDGREYVGAPKGCILGMEVGDGRAWGKLLRIVGGA